VSFRRFREWELLQKFERGSALVMRNEHLYAIGVLNPAEADMVTEGKELGSVTGIEEVLHHHISFERECAHMDDRPLFSHCLVSAFLTDEPAGNGGSAIAAHRFTANDAETDDGLAGMVLALQRMA